VKRPLKIRIVLVLAATCAISATGLFAQDSPANGDAKSSRAAVAARQTSANAPDFYSNKENSRKPGRDEHRFWDKTNNWLFTGVAASRTLDYFSTLNMRSRGRQEILLTNDVVDNHAAFAVIEAAGTAASIGVSYLFHHYGHHKLERWASIVHIGLATAGAARNYSLKTAHPASSATP
jgi:hypothetical protein